MIQDTNGTITGNATDVGSVPATVTGSVFGTTLTLTYNYFTVSVIAMLTILL